MLHYFCPTYRLSAEKEEENEGVVESAELFFLQFSWVCPLPLLSPFGVEALRNVSLCPVW